MPKNCVTNGGSGLSSAANDNGTPAPISGASHPHTRPALPRILNVVRPKAVVTPGPPSLQSDAFPPLQAHVPPAVRSPLVPKTATPLLADPFPTKTRPAVQATDEDRDTISAQPSAVQEAQLTEDDSVSPAPTSTTQTCAGEETVDVLPQDASSPYSYHSSAVLESPPTANLAAVLSPADSVAVPHGPGLGYAVRGPSGTSTAPTIPPGIDLAPVAGVTFHPRSAFASAEGDLAALKVREPGEYDPLDSGTDILGDYYARPGILSLGDYRLVKYSVAPFQPHGRAGTFQQVRDRLGEAVVAELCATGELYRFVEGEVDYVAGAAATVAPRTFRPDWHDSSSSGGEYLEALTEVTGELGVKNVALSEALSVMRAALAALAPTTHTAALCLGAVQALNDLDPHTDAGYSLKLALQRVEHALPGLRLKATVDGEAVAVRQGAMPQVVRQQAGRLAVEVDDLYDWFVQSHQGAVAAAGGLLATAAVATDLAMTVKGGHAGPLALQTAAEKACDAVLGLCGPSVSLTAAIDAIAVAVNARGPAQMLPSLQALEDVDDLWHVQVDALVGEREMQRQAAAAAAVPRGGSLFSHFSYV